MAIQACQAGHVKIAGQRVKPSREVHLGEVITALTGHVERTVKVLAMLERRVGAARVGEFLEDLTPAEEYARARAEALKIPPQYRQGFGRPTKKQRRQMNRFLNDA